MPKPCVDLTNEIIVRTWLIFFSDIIVYSSLLFRPKPFKGKLYHKSYDS